MNRKLKPAEVWKQNHLKALSSIAPKCGDISGLYRALRRLQGVVSRACVAQCNGESYEGQPYRDEMAWENFLGGMKNRVRVAFGSDLPQGFFINTDPRGYAFKLDNEKTALPEGMHKDWGGYGILAPDF